jgi:hypothetical protein
MHGLWREFPQTGREHNSVANLNLVGDDGAVFVAHGFDFAYGKAAISQIGKSSLEGLVQLVLQGGRLLRRSEDAGIDAILLAMAIVGEKEKLHLLLVDGHADLWLIAEPGVRREQDKD